MNIKSELIETYNEVFSTYKEFEKTLIETHLNKLKELDMYLPLGNTFFILTNTTKGTFEYVSKNFSYVFGIDRELMYEHGVPFWLSNFHEKDAPIWVGVLADLMNYTMHEIPFEKRANINYQWNFRVRNSSGKYLNIVENQIPLYFDDSGKPVIGIGHLNVIGEDEDLPLKASVRLLNEKNEYETIYHKNYSQLALPSTLTNREMDIIRLLVMNKSSKEIAESLFISSHTVDTHRRNILHKLKLNSTNEIVTYFLKNGYF